MHPCVCFHTCSSCSNSVLEFPCKFEVVFCRKPRVSIHIFAVIISISAAAALQAMLHKRGYVHDQQEDSATSTDQENNVTGSPFSGDEAYEVNAPSPKKRKGAQKRVVSVPIGDGDGTRNRTEVYPPPDSWSWRKYGQKPIKGSPYPRGYYRCSSSKGCPARKQVERSRLDPTKLLITYSCEHNHPLPTTTKHHHHHNPSTNAAAGAALTAATSTSTSSSSTATNASAKFEELAVFANQPDLESDSSSFSDLAGELGWFSDLGLTMLDGPMLVGPRWVDADVALMLPIGEEDQSLFGDLGELPECSVVFRQARVADAPCCGSTG